MTEAIELTSRVNYPREAASGSKYLVSIDLDHALTPEAWPYEDEEYPVTCFLDATPAFAQEPAGDPTIIVHRFGGSYGPAQFWLTAGAPGEASIRFVLVNGAGVPIAVRELRVPIVDRVPRVKQSVEAVELVADGETAALSGRRTVRRPQAEMVFRWLQLGDLRATSRSNFAKSPLAADVQQRVIEGQHLDAVIVTGNLSMGGRREEFDRAGEFLYDLRRRIADIQEHWPPLLVVPGSLDLDFDQSGGVIPEAAAWEGNSQLRRRFWASIRTKF